MDAAPLRDPKKGLLGNVRREDPNIPESLKDPVDVIGTKFFIERLYDAGLCNYSQEGFAEPLKWVDIKAWLDCSQLELSGAETEIIRNLSIAYAVYKNKAKDRLCFSPTETKEDILKRLSE